MKILEKIAMMYVKSVLDDIYVVLESKKNEINDVLDTMGPHRHTDRNVQKEAS